jgi:hypothetical protein
MAADPTALALVAAGGVAIGGAVAWRQVARHGRKRTLLRRLASPVPDRRARAAVDLVDLGLGRVAGPLLAHVATEEDARVRRDLALAVARRQWEPNGSARVAELRQWARGELEHQGFDVVAFGPAFTRLSDMGGPRLPERDPDAGFDAAPGDDDAPVDGDGEVPELYWTPAPIPDLVPDRASGDRSTTETASIEEEGAPDTVAAPQPT